MRDSDRVYDVVIAGGGLAGLSLARQLSRGDKELSVLVLDQLRSPLPEAAFKVGESTVELGTHYYADLLGLGPYLEKNHIGKLGLRFFYPSSPKKFWERSEFGVSTWVPAHAYQLDRGKLENHLRQVVVEDGVELREGVSVTDIHLGTGSQPHVVTHTSEDNGTLGQSRGRWVVDATGRRRLLQRKLGLTKVGPGLCSASWFRVAGELSVEQIVPKSQAEWHDRVGPPRSFSTNHLMGKGSWIWIIPLSSGHTSVGIVTREDHVPFSEYNTLEKAKQWIHDHEPDFATVLDEYEVLDFRTMRRYTYSSHQVFSEDRWSCVGEAGVFADPYYSVGLNLIAFSNGLTTKLIELEAAGTLTDEFVDHANSFYLSLNDSLVHNIQTAYPFYHHPQVMSLKTLWDFCVGWCIADPNFYQGIYLDPKTSRIASGLTSRIVVTQQRLLRLFADWAAKPPDEFSFNFEFINYLEDLPTFKDMHVRNLPADKTIHEILDDRRRGVDFLEELANVIFFLAVEDTMPEELARFEEHRWINTCAIGLDKTKWDDEGLFQPESPPRDVAPLNAELRSLYTFVDRSTG